MKITVIGFEYFGITTAVLSASLNHHVIGADADSTKVNTLTQWKDISYLKNHILLDSYSLRRGAQ